MGFLNSLDISGSGLTAQKMRMDILAQNIANAETTRTAEGGPYRRQMVVFQEDPGSSTSSFASHLSRARVNQNPGVKVVEIVEDQTDFKPVYDPEHPDADEIAPDNAFPDSQGPAGSAAFSVPQDSGFHSATQHHRAAGTAHSGNRPEILSF